MHHHWALHTIVVSYLSSLDLVCCHWALSFIVIGFDLVQFVSIHPHWFWVSVVGFPVLCLLLILPIFLLFVSPPPPPLPACFASPPLASHPSSVLPILFFIISSSSPFLCPFPLPHCHCFLLSSSSCHIASMLPLIFVASGSHLVLVARSEVSVREIGKGIVKMNHDKGCGSYFIMC